MHDQFQQVDRVHIGETFTAITYVKSTSPWPIDIISSEIILVSLFIRFTFLFIECKKKVSYRLVKKRQSKSCAVLFLNTN